MRDWDRLVMMGVGIAVSVHTAIQGWQLWRRRRRLAAAGLALLILAALGAPIILALASS